VRTLARKKGEEQLVSIASVLDGGVDFMAALQSLDGERYRTLTSNFRNLASHAIAPRLTVDPFSYLSQEEIHRRFLGLRHLVKRLQVVRCLGNFNDPNNTGGDIRLTDTGGIPEGKEDLQGFCSNCHETV